MEEKYYNELGIKTEEEFLKIYGYKVVGINDYLKAKNITAIFRKNLQFDIQYIILDEMNQPIGYIKLFDEDYCVKYYMEIMNDKIQVISERKLKKRKYDDNVSYSFEEHRLEELTNKNGNIEVYKYQALPSQAHLIIESANLEEIKEDKDYNRFEIYIGREFDWYQPNTDWRQTNQEFFIDFTNGKDNVKVHERIGGIWDNEHKRSESLKYCKYVNTSTKKFPLFGGIELFDRVYETTENNVMTITPFDFQFVNLERQDLYKTPRENNENRSFICEGNYVGEHYNGGFIRKTDSVTTLTKDIDENGFISHLDLNCEENLSLDEKIVNTPEMIDLYCRFKDKLADSNYFLILQKYINENHMLSLVEASLQNETDLVRKINKTQ